MAAQNSDVRPFDPNRVRPFPDQPRKRFWGINRLAKSILTIGQTSSGIVTIVDDDPNFDAELVDGERRLRACKVAKVSFRAEVWTKEQAGDYMNRYAHSIAANFQKQDHDVLEIAGAIEKLANAGKSLVEIAAIFGKTSAGWAKQHLYLLKLDPRVQDLLVPKDEEEIEDEVDLGDDDVPDAPTRNKLTLQLALLLVPFPKELQYPLAAQIINMPFAEARRVVLKAKDIAGIRSKRETSKSEQFGSLLNFVRTTGHKVGIYTDMNGHDFNEILASSNTESRMLLARTLAKLREDLGMLADSIEDYRPKRIAQSA
jgi:ParB/RepB/Spo0J family partition protein